MPLGWISVCGMVKDDRHRTRGLLFHEQEIRIPLTSEGFKLVTRIQDEVHRFAITYHRKLRDERNLHSVLDDIKGIGEVRRKALLRHFGCNRKVAASRGGRSFRGGWHDDSCGGAGLSFFPSGGIAKRMIFG